MATLTFPSITPTSITWSLVPNTRVFRSPLDGSVQTNEIAGARWAATMSFNNLSEADSRTMASFLTQLRGASGRFYLHHFGRGTPQGTATGVPVINGASQAGNSVVTDGWSNSVTDIVKAGDYLGFNDELHMVTANANSDGSGNATITIEPPMRTSPADDDTITVTDPTCIMRLTDDRQLNQAMSSQMITLGNFTINCIESFI